MEEEVGQGEAEEEVAAVEADLLAAHLEGHVALFGAVQLFLADALEELDGAGDACLEFVEGGFRIRVARHFQPGQPRAGALGGVAGDLHLARQGEHVRRQPGVDEDARIDVLRFGVGGGFLQDRREVAEGAQEGRDRSLVDRQGHGRAPDRG